MFEQPEEPKFGKIIDDKTQQAIDEGTLKQQPDGRFVGTKNNEDEEPVPEEPVKQEEPAPTPPVEKDKEDESPTPIQEEKEPENLTAEEQSMRETARKIEGEPQPISELPPQD